MAAMMTTKELAASLDVHPGTVYTWGKNYGCPCLTNFFKGGSGRGGSRRGIGWDPDEVRRWLLGTNRMDRKTGKLTCICPARRKCNRKPKPDMVTLPPPAPGQTRMVLGGEVYELSQAELTEDGSINSGNPGFLRYVLAHLLASFAHTCQGGGIPKELQNALEDEGLGELRKEALDHIEAMAQETLTTASQWTLIKQAWPALAGQGRKAKRKV